jgi:protein O-GlcNAc transferase
MLDRLASFGLPRDRVLWRTWDQSLEGHLKSYDAVDVALDPFPYCGTTTTCEALLMGVPVVTLAGQRHASRVGVSLLSQAGLSDLITSDEDAYVRTAASLATDAARLARVRADLRDRVMASALWDQAGFSTRILHTLRNVWRARCEASSPNR